MREGGKFLSIFNVNQNCAENVFINMLIFYMYTFHIVITKLCEFIAETNKTHYFKVTVLRKLKIKGFFLFIRISIISFLNVSM